MSITIEQAAEYVGCRAEDTELTRCLLLANDIVVDYIAGAWRSIPVALEDEGVLRATYNLYWQGKTTGAAAGSILGADGTVITPGVATDPLHKVRPLFARYLDRV